ncbi:MAG: copper-binding protein, partial [Acidobacteria bacterium]|nr:copper-binding protein [Acidobacteriota bacterium]
LKTLRVLIVTLAALLAGACVKSPPAAATHKNVQRYDLKGVVVRLRAEDKVAVIKHERIQNQAGKVWMEPMTMDFPVPNASELQQMKVGQTVHARVNQDRDTLEYWLDQVR